MSSGASTALFEPMGRRRGPQSLVSPGTATQLLVRLLEQENNWWRLTGHRMLIEEQDPSAIPVLRTLVQGDPPPVRVHALYVLDAYSALDHDLLETALKDAYPGVRENALRLAEGFPTLEGALAKMVDDPSSQVALQLALSLGEFSGQESFQALVTLASRYGQDTWFRTAILSSERGSSARLLQDMLRAGEFFREPDPEKEKFLEELAAVIGARNRAQEVGRMMNLLSRTRALQAEGWQVAGLNGLSRGLELAGAHRLKIPGTEAMLFGRLRSSSEKVQTAALILARHFEIRSLILTSANQAADETLSIARRKAAIQSLAGGEFSDVRRVLEELLDAQLGPELLRTTILTLGLFEGSGVTDLLIPRWKKLGPEARNQALDVLLGHRARVPQLFEAIAAGHIERAALDLPRREKLLHNPDAEVRDRAAPLFQKDDEQSGRAQLWESYRSVLDLEGDSTRGKPVFEEKCGTCHLPREDKQVGPDLARVERRHRDSIAAKDPGPQPPDRPELYELYRRDNRRAHPRRRDRIRDSRHADTAEWRGRRQHDPPLECLEHPRFERLPDAGEPRKRDEPTGPCRCDRLSARRRPPPSSLILGSAGLSPNPRRVISELPRSTVVE